MMSEASRARRISAALLDAIRVADDAGALLLAELYAIASSRALARSRARERGSYGV